MNAFFVMWKNLFSKLKKSIIWRFLSSVGAAITMIINRIISFFSRKNSELDITPQVCFLEKALNDAFDNELRRIYISEMREENPLFFFSDVLFRDWYFGDNNFFSCGIGVAGYLIDFIVYIPQELEDRQVEITAFVKKYKLIGITFKIEII